jgi:cytochrome c oxidase subunit III
MRHRPVQDISALPDYAFGTRMTTWWGTLAFCAVEGAGFAMVVGAYMYLVFINPQWPLSAPAPDLLWSGLLTLLLLASVWPNHLAGKSGKEQDRPKVQRYLTIMCLIGVVLLGIRFFEFYNLHTRWDQNAYGSIVWFVLGLHTLHILTDLGDTIVLTVLMFTRHGHGKRFSDVEDNAFYWNFVVITWLPIYALLYWVPRM